MILLCGSEKGGVGKTTVSANLLAMLALDGKSVIGVDADGQGGLTLFNEYRNKEGVQPFFPVVQQRVMDGGPEAGEALFSTLLDLGNKYEHVVVDTGGHNSIELRVVLSIADILLSPCFPGLLDLNAVKNLTRNVREAEFGRSRALGKMRALFVLNRVNTHPLVTTHLDAKEALEQVDGFELLDVCLHDRISHVYSLAKGMSVVEMKGSERDPKAIHEVEELYRGIYG